MAPNCEKASTGQHKLDHSLIAPGRLEVGAVGGRGDAAAGPLGAATMSSEKWICGFGCLELPLEILKRGLDCIAGLEAGPGARIRNKR